MKIGIIGMGWVGSSVAISILQAGFADQLLLNDAKPGLAEGEAMDLAQGSAFYPSARVFAADISEMRSADAVVISAGRGGTPGESRLALLQENAEIVRQVATELQGFAGLIVVVTNPVDVLTQIAYQASGLPKERVLGTGTMLDTARVRQKLGAELNLDPRSVHCQIVGEHGDSQVCLWSSAKLGGKNLRDWPNWNSQREENLAAEVRGAAQQIIKRKGATNHAIGLVTSALIRWSQRGPRRILTVSRIQDGALGLRDIALSLPAMVGRDGAVEVIEPNIDEREREAILASAEVLKSALRNLGQ